MIEGLRVLPFWQGLIAADPKRSDRDCTTCMSTLDVNTRRLMRCGRIPPIESVGGMPVLGWPVPDQDWRTETCPTYTTSLPEVVAVAEAYPQWKERTLTDWLGEKPTPETLQALAVLGNAISAHEAHKIEQRRREKAGT